MATDVGYGVLGMARGNFSCAVTTAVLAGW